MYNTIYLGRLNWISTDYQLVESYVCMRAADLYQWQNPASISPH